MRTYTTGAGTTAYLKDDSVDVESVNDTVLDEIVNAAAPLYAGTPQSLVITSAADGEHMDGSLHKPDNGKLEGGQALDLRVWALRNPEGLARGLQEELGPDYDVVLEWRTNEEGEEVPSHIHVEKDLP